MTQKELLYVEDAIGHEKAIINILNESISMLKNEKLVNYLKKDLKEHEDIKKKLLHKLEGESNE